MFLYKSLDLKDTNIICVKKTKEKCSREISYSLKDENIYKYNVCLDIYVNTS